MATYYVRGSATASGAIGSNAAAGTSWTVPKQTVAGALAIAGLASGDIIACDYQGLFTAAAAITWTIPAAVTSIAIVSAIPSGSTGYTVQSGARENVGSANGAFGIVAAGNNTAIVVSGMWIEGGSTVSATNNINLLNTTAITAVLHMVSCTLHLAGTGLTSVVCGLSAGAGSRSVVINFRGCTFQYQSRAGTAILLGESVVDMLSCTFDFQGATKPAQYFATSNLADTAVMTARCMSFVGGNATVLLTNMSSSKFLFTNCELDFTPTGTWPGGSASVTLRNCALADVINGFEYNDAYGSVQADTTAALNAEFAGVGVSWFVSTTALASEFRPFILPLLEVWNEVLEALTARIEYTLNSALLTDRDIWVEMTIPNSVDNPKYTALENRNNQPFIGTPVAHPTSTVTWTGEKTYKQTLELAFTAPEVGLLQAQISIGRPSTLVFVNPVLELT